MTHNPEQEEEEKQKSNGIHNHLSYRVGNTFLANAKRGVTIIFPGKSSWSLSS